MVSQRDVFKDVDYYSDCISYKREVLPKFIDKANDQSESENRRRNLTRRCFNIKIEIVNLMYSRGDSLEDIKSELIDSISLYTKLLKNCNYKIFDLGSIDDYPHALWLASLAYCLDIDDQKFRELVDAVDNEGKDLLYEHIVGLRIHDRKPAETLCHPRIYGSLYEGINNPAKVTEFLKYYYKEIKNAYWHDRHLQDDTGYFGYWCFEVAAIVRAHNIDDSAFADSIYYPRDLTGQRIYKTWEDSPEGEEAREAIKEIQHA